MEYDFLVDTYDIERLKTLNVWSMFGDEDLAIRPHHDAEDDADGVGNEHPCGGTQPTPALLTINHQPRVALLHP